MIKNFKKISLCMLVTGFISASVATPAFATSNEKMPPSQDISEEIQSRLPTSPSSYEYTSETTGLDKDGLWDLKTYADRAHSQGTASSYVSLASFMLGVCGFSNSSTALGGISYMISSDLDAYGTLNYAFTEYRYLDENSDVDSVQTNIKFKRFFDGSSMHNWYPYDSPSEA